MRLTLIALIITSALACGNRSNGRAAAPPPAPTDDASTPAPAPAFGAYSGHTITQQRVWVGETPVHVPPPPGTRDSEFPLYSPIDVSLAWVQHEERVDTPSLRLRLVEAKGMEITRYLFELSTGWSTGPVTQARTVAPAVGGDPILFEDQVTWNGRTEHLRVVRQGDDLVFEQRTLDGASDTGFVERDRIMLPSGAVLQL